MSTFRTINTKNIIYSQTLITARGYIITKKFKLIKSDRPKTIKRLRSVVLIRHPSFVCIRTFSGLRGWIHPPQHIRRINISRGVYVLGMVCVKIAKNNAVLCKKYEKHTTGRIKSAVYTTRVLFVCHVYEFYEYLCDQIGYLIWIRDITREFMLCISLNKYRYRNSDCNIEKNRQFAN